MGGLGRLAGSGTQFKTDVLRYSARRALMTLPRLVTGRDSF
jgi:hypothetical protein